MRSRTCTARAAKSAQHRGCRRSTGVRFGSHMEEEAARGSVRATRPQTERRWSDVKHAVAERPVFSSVVHVLLGCVESAAESAQW